MRTITQSLGYRTLVLALGTLAGVSCASAPNHDTDDQSSEEARRPKPPKPLAPKLDPTTIPKFVNQMPRLPTYHPKIITDAFGSPIRKEFNVDVAKFEDQQLPPPFPKTLLFGYGGDVLVDDCANVDATTHPRMMAAAEARCRNKVKFVRTSPGPTFEQTRNLPAIIHLRNDLEGPHPLPVDPTLDWANPNNFPKPTPPFLPFPPGYPQAQQPIAHTTHSHGLEVRPEFDGTPDTWFTANGIKGPEFVSNDIQQPSSNNASAFWYHDHTFGVTRLDVGMGLNGFSILRDPASPIDFPQPGNPQILPSGEFEVQMIIGDRSYRTDGSIFYPTAQEQHPGTLGANPDVNPYWMLNIDGDVNIVNGKVWPNFNVKRALYRFRILVASNQRFYHFKFSNGMSFQVIGMDGGFLDHAKTISSWTQGVTERVDLLVDFRNIPVGTKIILQNDEQLFPPVGPPPNPNTDGTVMQFSVVGGPVVNTPAPLAPDFTLNNIPTLVPNRPTRTLIQNVESDDAGRVLQAELDGQLFHTLTTELPTIGSTEDWEFVNTTPLTHNKHVHLIEFQLLNRQNFDNVRYLADWKAVNGNPPFTHPTIKLPVGPYLMGDPTPPDPEESGWKDTIRTPAGQVTRIRIRWAPQSAGSGAGTPGENLFVIDPIYGIGFIWHCHLLEHEDNEMMRPMTVIPTWMMGASYPVGFRGSPGVNRGLVDFNGVDYSAKVAIPSSTEPPDQRPDLWERINNQNGDWAVQIIYQVGDRARFNNRIYRALQKHQATPATEPDVAPPGFWELVL